MQDNRPLAIAIMGPTASGKTALAVQWAERLDTEIISVDSALVYRGLNIGAAKPDAETLSRAPHRMIDIRDPHQVFSAADFAKEALPHMQALSSTGKIPLLVGGTGLYFRALIEGLSAMPAADPAVRAELNAEAEKLGWAALHARLHELDPISASKIHPNDPQRIVRALEIHQLSGRSRSAWQADTSREPFGFRVLNIVLAPSDRAVLHERIATRFDDMLQHGFLDEMRGLMANPALHADLPSMRAVGYRQAWQHLQGEYDFATFREQAIAATRQLAKRQLTWFRGQPSSQWFNPQSETDAINYTLEAFLASAS